MKPGCEEVREPWVDLEVVCRDTDIGIVMDLTQKRRAIYKTTEYLDEERVVLKFEMPLAAIVLDFFDKLKSGTEGYGSMSYEPLGLVWLKPGPVRRRERSEAGAGQVNEAMTGETRSDGRLTNGRMLRFGGADWRIVSGETVGGRAILNLERMR